MSIQAIIASNQLLSPIFTAIMACPSSNSEKTEKTTPKVQLISALDHDSILPPLNQLVDTPTCKSAAPPSHSQHHRITLCHLSVVEEVINTHFMDCTCTDAPKCSDSQCKVRPTVLSRSKNKSMHPQAKTLQTKLDITSVYK